MSNTIIEESRKIEHQIEPKHSKEYTKLLEELIQSFVSADNIAVKLYNQGKKDGLSNEEIREDIEIILDGVVNERRLSGIMPAELTRSYVQAITSNSAIIAAETKNQTKEEMTTWREIRHQVLDRIKKTGGSNNKLQRKSKSRSKKVGPQSIALIASIIVIIIVIGGLSLQCINILNG